MTRTWRPSTTFFPVCIAGASPRPSHSVAKRVWTFLLHETQGTQSPLRKRESPKSTRPADNLQSKAPDRHYVALVSFEGQIEDPAMPRPRVWIIPYPAIERFTRQYQNRRNVSRSAVCNEGMEYENAWHLIEATHPACQETP